MIAVVRVCSGETAGIELLAETGTSPVFGARQVQVTTWTSPEPVRLIGETDLIGDTSWAMGSPVRALDEGAIYLMSAVSTSGASVGRPLRFSPEAFEGIGVEQVLTVDGNGPGSRYVSMVDFVTTVCDAARPPERMPSTRSE